METKSKKAVIYCRVSTKEQVDDGNSLKTQKQICKDYALKNGYEIVEEFIEEGESAKNKDRTQLGRLLSYCTDKRNGISAVIAYKIDRVARNIDDYRYIRLLLKKYNVEIKSTSEYFEDTPAGRFMENIIANVAQFDNDVRTERSVGGMRDAMREGRYVWNASLGYSNAKVGEKSNIVLNEKAPVVLKLFEEVAKNKYSVDSLRRTLQKEGLTTKKGAILTRSHCYRILNNEVYAGWIIKFGERHKGLFEPIVSEALFEQVQRVLKQRSHRGFTYQRENPDFPLRRFVFYPTGQKLTGAWSQGRKRKYAYYRFIGIHGLRLKKELLETAFMAFLDRYTLDPALIDDLKVSLKDTLDSKTENECKEAKRLQAYIVELNDRQTALIEKNDKGIISDTILRRQLDLIDEKLLQANAELLSLPDKQEDIGELIEFAREHLENLSAAWEKAPFKQKLELQWFVFPQGVTLKNGNYRTAQIASIFKAKDILSPHLSSKVRLRGQDYEKNNGTNEANVPIEMLHQIAKELYRLKEIMKNN